MKIERYFVLNKYLLSLFGVDDFKDLQQKLKDAQEGIDSDGRTYFVNTLISAFSNRKISEEDLLRYDLNIQDYVRRINFKRGNVTLKYFQYLAVLFTEIVLDNLKNRKLRFIYELNEFLSRYKDEEVKDFIVEFNEDDLKKLAFYMATGSGKTLIAHINYYQFFNYKLFSPDNILFITPNEGLSKQHFEELQKSGIPAKLYSGNLNTNIRASNEVLVIEMTKFVEEKKGGGVTLPVDTFEGKNLIFIDEGHKGKKSEEQKWAKLRDKLAENGFVFEYSATFGQILSERNKEILKEYAKSIIFDYSYKYFYLDGYGKDFFVANVSKTKISKEKFPDIMFVANLLSFYEQLLIYEENKDIVKTYNIEKPLWIFVGTTVTGKKKSTEIVKEEEETLTDIMQILELIEKAIKEENWLKEIVEEILTGETGIKNEEGKDIFYYKFEYLKKRKKISLDDLYEKVFNGKGKLYIYEIKNAEGEFGLKVSENTYFGVINIGDVSGLKKQLQQRNFTVKQDAVSSSLFENIKEDDSKINILIGARKFIEGWDTWRVSSMGLLNIGKGQGPQIIQLFGRGVRLKGKNMSLKRSEENNEIRYLETLNIYSINADYLKKFLEAIRKEEVEFETIEIPIKLQHEDKWKELNILCKDNTKKFEEEILKLEYDDKISFTIDLTLRISIYEAKERKEERGEIRDIKFDEGKSQGEPAVFPQDKIGLLNWGRILQEIYEWKRSKRYWNLIIDEGIVKNLLTSNRFTLLLPKDAFEVKTQKDIKKLEDIAISIIKKYIEKFYERNAKIFETSNLTYKTVENQKQQLLLPFISEDKEKYIVQIKKDKQKLINEIKNLITRLEELYTQESEELPRVYIDNHLFLPLLIKSKEIDKLTPEGLVESEKKFIIDLKYYFKNNKEKLKDYEIYILRNFSKSGVGFQLQWFKFYPDFIMWIKRDNEQIIVFIEPHGLEHSKGLNDEKIQFARSTNPQMITIKEIEQKLKQKQKKDFRLEYFLLSATKYDDLEKGTVDFPSKEEYENNHVLFIYDDVNWPEKLFKKIGVIS